MLQPCLASFSVAPSGLVILFGLPGASPRAISFQRFGPVVERRGSSLVMKRHRFTRIRENHNLVDTLCLIHLQWDVGRANGLNNKPYSYVAIRVNSCNSCLVVVVTFKSVQSVKSVVLNVFARFFYAYGIHC